MKKVGDEYEIKEIVQPKKFIIKNKIEENSLIWKKIAKKLKSKAVSLYNRY